MDEEFDKDTAPFKKEQFESLRRHIKEVITTATGKLRKGVVIVVGRLVKKARAVTDELMQIAGGAPQGGQWYDTAPVTVDILDHFEATLKLKSKKQLNNCMTAVEEASLRLSLDSRAVRDVCVLIGCLLFCCCCCCSLFI